jgi:branched-chain amino acid aminotransferase
MNYPIEMVAPEARRPRPQDESKLGFGKIYSDHMFVMRWTPDTGWTDAQVQPFQNLSLSPAALVLHYGQTIFEGLKAYPNADGNVNLFRAKDNAERFAESARRLDLPVVDTETFVAACSALLELDHEWIPKSHGTSLYLRPTMVATEPYIGLKSASEVLFYIITGPVGAYYPEGFDPVKIRVCEDYSRAGPGGLGSAKTGANYAASLLAEKEAVKAGFTQVLWLDAAERRYVEEVGAMNILFKINGTVISPPPGDTILRGITKDSVFQLLRSWGVPCEERRLPIDEVLQAHADGMLEEVFGAGTAAVISPVGQLSYEGKAYDIGDGSTGELALKLFDEIMGIQYGQRPDPFGWITEVVPGSK